MRPSSETALQEKLASEHGNLTNACFYACSSGQSQMAAEGGRSPLVFYHDRQVPLLTPLLRAIWQLLRLNPVPGLS